MKQSEAPLSHRTLTQLRLVGIRCICNRQEFAMLLSHTVADPEIPCKEASIFSSLWSVWWCHLVHPFTPQGLFFLHSSSLCPLLKHDQQAPFSFSISVYLHLVLIGRIYSRSSNDPIPCGTNVCYFWGRCCLLIFQSNPCSFLHSVLSPLLLR